MSVPLETGDAVEVGEGQDASGEPDQGETSNDNLSHRARALLLAVAAFFVVIIAKDVETADVRIEIQTRYAAFDFERGELLSLVADSMTLYDIDASQFAGSTQDGIDVTVDRADAKNNVTLSSISFAGDRRVRMTVHAQGVSGYDLSWQPYDASLAVISPEGSEVTLGNGEPVTQVSDTLQFLQPGDNTSRLAVTDPSSSGDVLRTDTLVGVSFTPPMSTDDDIVFSEIVDGTIVWYDLDNEIMDIPHGETVALEFVDTATLTLTLEPEGIDVVIAGKVSDVRFGAADNADTTMPSWFQFLSHHTWAKAASAFIAVFLVPVMIERWYAK
ncbi:MAG: hypothetical protein AAFQ62_00775 [Pseudomonadota bacterium]